MKVKINYDEIDNLTSYINDQHVKMDSLFKDISKDLSDVDKCWKGNDCDTFINVSNEYMKDALESLNSLSTFKDNLSDMVKLYKNEEANFLEKTKES